jgi:penicillin-binding protein 1C
MIAALCCPHTHDGPFIAGVSPIATCDVHRVVHLDAAGRQVAAARGTAVVREFWPADRLEQFRRAGLPRLEPPEWASGERVASAKNPTIVSPQSPLTYVLQPEIADKRAIPLQARVAPGVKRVHWFADSQYLGSSLPSQPLLWSPMPGRWTVQVTDDHGLASSVAVTVARSAN